MKIKDPDNGCKGCLWLDKEGLCPFQRCIKKNGWIADKTYFGDYMDYFLRHRKGDHQ